MRHDEPRKTHSVVPAKYKEAYGKAGNNGDWIALALAEADLEQAARDNNVDFEWAHLNPGMQRMNLGNVLRGMWRRGEKVVVVRRRATPETLSTLPRHSQDLALT